MSELVVVTVVLLVVIISGLRILQQFQRGLVFRLGRYQGTRGPGLTWNIIDSVTEPWGIAVDRVQIKDVGNPQHHAAGHGAGRRGAPGKARRDRGGMRGHAPP